MYTTTVKKKAGLNAVWNERFEIDELKPPNEIYFQVFGKGMITD